MCGHAGWDVRIADTSSLRADARVELLQREPNPAKLVLLAVDDPADRAGLLALGCGEALPSGTGIAHTFLNNTEEEVRLLVVGEKSKPENRIDYPRNPEQKARRKDWWDNPPPRQRGDHDGMTDKVRADKVRADKAKKGTA